MDHQPTDRVLHCRELRHGTYNSPTLQPKPTPAKPSNSTTRPRASRKLGRFIPMAQHTTSTRRPAPTRPRSRAPRHSLNSGVSASRSAPPARSTRPTTSTPGRATASLWAPSTTRLWPPRATGAAARPPSPSRKDAGASLCLARGEEPFIVHIGLGTSFSMLIIIDLRVETGCVHIEIAHTSLVTLTTG